MINVKHSLSLKPIAGYEAAACVLDAFKVLKQTEE